MSYTKETERLEKKRVCIDCKYLEDGTQFSYCTLDGALPIMADWRCFPEDQWCEDFKAK